MGAWLESMILAGTGWMSFPGRKKVLHCAKAGEIVPALFPEQQQIGKYADAFYGLARLFQELPCQKERLGDAEMEQLFFEVHETVCSGCRREESCWGNYYFQSCRTLYELTGALECDGGISEEKLAILEPFCLNAEEIARTLEAAFGRARLNLLWENRMLEQRMAAGEQIYQTAELLRRAADGFVRMPDLEYRLQKKLPRRLKYLGLHLDGLRVFKRETDQMEVFLALHQVREERISTKTIAEELSACCHTELSPAKDCCAVIGADTGSFHFVQKMNYQLLGGISRITKSGELVSGDSFSFLSRDGGKVVMSLADGMGSGVDACRESEKAIELLEQFLEAGFPQETAVRMINSCMLLQNRDQMFSTIDLCMVDLYSGGCDLIKSGAAATFLKHGDSVEVIHSGAMPPGILQQSDYESMHRQLAKEDTIVMMTDGVLEALPEENRDARMAELICLTAVPNAKEHAQRLMERIYLMQKLQAKDDMTILIGKLWDRT